MGGYSDYLKDAEHARFLAKWVPASHVEAQGLNTRERWYLANWRSNAARVEELESVLRGLREAMKGIS